MNEMEVYLPDEAGEHEGFVRILAGPDHPFHDRFNPGPGIGISYEDLKIIEAYQFLRSVVENKAYEPNLKQAYQYAQVLEAMMRSWESNTWEDVKAI